jgi:DNA-binding response OmpR family regulator
MYVLLDDRAEVRSGYATSFRREGVVAFGFSPEEFQDWFTTVSDSDFEAVRGFLIGEFDGSFGRIEAIRRRSQAPMIALTEVRSMERTLQLFTAGIDHVLQKPIHVKEIIARSDAVWRRINRKQSYTNYGRLKIHFDGRDPEVDGEPLMLPRRERRILEFLVSNSHRRVTKSQIFNAVYGIFEESVDEVVVEGHVSKLRRKLRTRLGFDVIDAKRYLGYQFVGLGTDESSISGSAMRRTDHRAQAVDKTGKLEQDLRVYATSAGSPQSQMYELA